MRNHKLAAFVVVMAIIAAACSSVENDNNSTATTTTTASSSIGEDGKSENSAEAATLSLWSREATRGAIEPLIEAYNALGGDQIEATFTPNEQFIANFGAALAAGESPDLVSIDLIYTPAFMEAGQLEEIGDLINALPYADTLSPAHIALGTSADGKQYAVPFAAEGSVLAYNIDLFEAAGLDPEDPPTSWAEVYTAAEAISALNDDTYGFWISGACAGCNAFTFLPWIWAADGDVLSADSQTPTIVTDPKVAEALDVYRRMWEAGFMPADAEVDDGTLFLNAFAGGNVGMAGTGAFSIAALTKDFPDLNFGLTFLPGDTEGSASSFAGGDSIAVPKGSQYREKAWSFIEWVLSEETQLEYYAKNGQLPLRTDLAENVYFADEPRLVIAAKAMGMGRTPYSSVYNDLFNDPNGPWLQMLQEAIFDGDVDGAIQRGQERFERILGG